MSGFLTAIDDTRRLQHDIRRQQAAQGCTCPKLDVYIEYVPGGWTAAVDHLDACPLDIITIGSSIAVLGLTPVPSPPSDESPALTALFDAIGTKDAHAKVDDVQQLAEYACELRGGKEAGIQILRDAVDLLEANR